MLPQWKLRGIYRNDKKSLFNFAIMAFSNVTTTVHFHVNINEQKLTVDENSQNLIESTSENDESNDDNESMNHGSPYLRLYKLELYKHYHSN